MKDGSQSQFPLTRIAAKYNQIQKDGRVLSNRASLDILYTRIQQLAERIDLNEAPDRLAKIYQLWQDFEDQGGGGSSPSPQAIKIKFIIDEEFEKAYHDYAAWKQMFEAIDLNRKLVESEVKIMKDLKAIMTAEDAYELSAKLLASIIATVNQAGLEEKQRKYILNRIQYEFTRIVGDGDNQGVAGSGPEDIDPGSDQVD